MCASLLLRRCIVSLYNILALVVFNYGRCGMILLDQAEGPDVGYYLGVIPYRIIISEEVANYFGMYHSCVTMDT